MAHPPRLRSRVNVVGGPRVRAAAA
ncbi:MAG: hypothetical protein JWP29_3091, partial [Rhodoferax sp.]|nr:hypothetical protein [Rhodoferax sp.]